VRYTSGPAAGHPAITTHVVGSGSATYISTELDDDGLTRTLTDALALAQVTPDAPGAGGGLEAIRRSAGDDEYLILINHDEREHETVAGGTDLLTGAWCDGSIVLAPGAMLALRQPGS
jgi:beta-galactosidase